MLLELLPPRLFFFILGAIFIYTGVHYWGEVRHENRQIERALGSEGTTVDGEIYMQRSKTVVTYSFRGKTFFEEPHHTTKLVEQAPEGQKLKLRLHPDNPAFVVPADATSPSGFWAIALCLFAIVLGGLMDLAVLISLFA